MAEPNKRIEVACPECGREFDVQAKAGFYPCPNDNCEGWVFIDAYRVLMEQYGCLVCGSHMPGDEDWDWCDHVTGRNCVWSQVAEVFEWLDYDLDDDLDEG
jgi:endogenous inhibitor of DNA gyrase (YacG/DUF329 family)